MKVCQFACSPRCLARARVFVKKVDHGCGCGMCGCGEKQQSEAYHVILVTCGHCNHVQSCEISFHLTQGLKLPELRFKFLSNLEDF